MKHLARKFGIESHHNEGVPVSKEIFNVRYPLNAVQYETLTTPYNIVWLTAESWRADMINEEIMPFTYGFAQKSHHFTQHFSGGNGTRFGMFSMFYGVPGYYWHSF